MVDNRKVAFNWYLNRQGPRGPQGVKGDTGFSPNISVETDTLNEYILRITNEGGYFLTSNLREHKEDRGGTYIRYDRENGKMYAGEADTATDAKAGIIKIATAEDVEAEDESTAVTPAILADYVAGSGGASIDDTTVSSSKVWSSEKTSQSIAEVSNQVATNTTDISNIKTALPNKQNKLTAGANITIEGDVISATGSGSGDVTLAGDNSFTGNNTFGGVSTFNGDTWIDSLKVGTSLKNQQDKLFLNQGSITAGDNVTIEETTDGVKISATGGGGSYTLPPATTTTLGGIKVGDNLSITEDGTLSATGGGGSTNITATLPLKIVDGVISLEVDGQTIQIVDGKLHANLDELNNPFSLFDGKYSDHELNNLSWLKSEGQWNAKAVYTDAYDKLLKVYNGTETVEGLSVKLSTETYTDYDFVLNTAKETFRLPLKSKLASGKAVVGNGMTLGLTNGVSNFAPQLRVQQGVYGGTEAGFGINVGTELEAGNAPADLKAIGVTTDPTKSGIETSDSGLYLYYYVGETVQNANLIDAGRIGEQLANKQDKLIRYPIEISDKSLMPSWYVVYNDGWCEQGGANTNDTNIVITLLKPYRDTNYSVIATPASDNTKNANYSAAIGTRTTTQFNISFSNNITGNSCNHWRAYGYIN